MSLQKPTDAKQAEHEKLQVFLGAEDNLLLLENLLPNSQQVAVKDMVASINQQHAEILDEVSRRRRNPSEATEMQRIKNQLGDEVAAICMMLPANERGAVAEQIEKFRALEQQLAKQQEKLAELDAKCGQNFFMKIIFFLPRHLQQVRTAQMAGIVTQANTAIKTIRDELGAEGIAAGGKLLEKLLAPPSGAYSPLSDTELVTVARQIQAVRNTLITIEGLGWENLPVKSDAAGYGNISFATLTQFYLPNAIQQFESDIFSPEKLIKLVIYNHMTAEHEKQQGASQKDVVAGCKERAEAALLQLADRVGQDKIHDYLANQGVEQFAEILARANQRLDAEITANPAPQPAAIDATATAAAADAATSNAGLIARPG